MSPPDPDRAWLAGLTILYVEDDELTRSMLATFLRRRAGRVVEAVDGVDGLARFRAERPALVITDIQMPGMDGLAMAAAIRRLDRAVPIVVTTAFEQIDYLERAIDVGVDKYVTKPVDLDKLEHALHVCARRLQGEAALAREREHELQAARAREREVIGLLAGGIAHDFNNLLQSILGNLSVLGDMALPRTTRELLEPALRSAEEAGALGGQLLTLAERAFGRFAARALGPTLRDSVARALAGSRTAPTWQVPDALPEVWHDDELLGQAFGSLARNAREAMADGGTLAVTAEVCAVGEGERAHLAAGPYVQVTFRDTGPGIAPEVLPRIFDPYFSTKERGAARGMGLGLAVCRAIVRQHRGEVIAASGPGEGAVLTVFLPTTHPEAPRHE